MNPIQSLYTKGNLDEVEELIAKVTNYAWSEMTLEEQGNLRERALLKYEALRTELAKEKSRTELFTNCLHRGLQMWKKENPEREDWISGDANIKWMLDEIVQLRARAEQAEAERDYTGELNKVVVAQNDTLKAALKHLQTYFEENHIERIKYPEYLEFHEYQMIAALAEQAEP